MDGDFDLVVDCVGGAAFALAIEHLARRGIVVNLATEGETVTFRLDGQVELEASWRDAAAALRALLERRFGGKAVLHVD